MSDRSLLHSVWDFISGKVDERVREESSHRINARIWDVWNDIDMLVWHRVRIRVRSRVIREIQR